MNVYNLELVGNNEIRNYVTHKQDVLSVDMLFYLTFFHNADVCIFVNTIAFFNLYSYKTNESFSQCP